MNILKNHFTKLITLTLIIAFGLFLTNTAIEAETIVDRMKGSITGIDLISGGDDPDAAAQGIVGRLIGAFLSVLGVIFMILLIYGGFRWMSARGNEDEVRKARDVIFQAIIGLIIIMSAYAITFFISVLVSSLGS